ncbi:MAG: uncharacterized membrane protein YgdD (TMEM256/DUF423 family) [Polaribacter sp.]|jgi:uncharacterized membrane protein YgdD (TMEM256/DUF423 family)|tara:strand:+ start:53 stop:430 length:378 start_codon:yes stop_codon:yes gene_type:complete
MNKVFWLRFVALNGVLSVVLGAFAAHGLEDQLSDRHMATFRTAVLYHFLHTLALLAVISLPDQLTKPSLCHWAAVSFAAGIVLFSGSLYLLVLTNTPTLGMVTPLGGLAFIAGWGLLFFAARRSQ